MKYDKDVYGKILVPMVTPFKKDQSVDYELAKGLADHLIESGNADSIILTGTTGEFHSMTREERIRMFKLMKEHVGDRIPMIAGVGAASTMESIELAREAEKLGYETVMVVAPYYTKPTQREIYSHFKKVAESVQINIILYNIPIFTGVNVDPETLRKLAEIENIVAIKEESELNPKQMTAFLNATPEDFIIYNGDDTMILECFAQGGPERIGGVVSGASHLIASDIREMINEFIAGNIQKAAHMQRRIYPVLKVMGQNGRTNPVSLWKEALRLCGIDAGYPREPLLPGTKEEIANIRKALIDLDLPCV